MGIFINNIDKIRSILEADNDEEDDYTAGVDDVGNDDPSDDNTDTSDDGGDDDYTAGVDDVGNDEGGDDSDTSSDSDESSDGGDDDYTSGVDDVGSDDSSDDSGEEGDSSDEGDEDNSDENSDDPNFENLKKIEAELFSNLTPEQIAIKNYELKQNFINLYSTIGATLSRINDITKSDNNIETLKFITTKLLELREMIDFNITTAYQTRTYIENSIIYQQCLSTLNAISDIISSIPNPIKDEKEEEEEEDNIVDDLDDEFSDTREEKLDIGDKMIESTNTFNDYL